MAIFTDFGTYIRSASDVKGQILKIDQVIDALVNSMLDSATKSGVMEYEMDSGQSRVKMKYRNPDQINKTIDGLRVYRMQLANQINESQICRLVPNGGL